MKSVLIKVVWDMLEKLDVTNVEAQILLSLAHATNASSGCCHPTQAQIAAKMHLSRSAVKENLSRLKAKGLVAWHCKPAHRNEYYLACAQAALQASGGGTDNGCIPSEDEYQANRAEYDAQDKRAVSFLAWAFTRLLRNGAQVPLALPEYRELIAVRSYGACQDLFFRLRSEIRQHEHDRDDIHALILREMRKIPVVGESDFSRTIR